ncbi:GAF domain-containing protein [Mucilaginibacter sp. RB4R14]|uniref:GAF domain-containing protein n=1 Tax=Mucilaginibacter aurantiaciroseus TaxID=2949308 RepID=UPI002090C0FF|nr:GAF domain-containing protein [Mucilaginibacter aurantiaciroseus]MCO5936384.1 GAF domain-containing protein [Mucilaginibacter aurantiaciroseus]
MNYTEQQRLSAVDRFKNLDDGITKDLNDIVALVSEICGTPVALVTLLDNEIQWFKAAVGTDVTDTPRSISFCNNTIEQEGVNIIYDLQKDDRHNQNPLVTGDPNVRFYAGSPLITKDGYAIGSLCVVDMEPRDLTVHQQKALQIMSKQVVNLMELNWSIKVLAEQRDKEKAQAEAITDSELKLKAIFDSSKDSHLLIGKNFEVLAFNKSASLFIHTVYGHALLNGDNLLDYSDPKTIGQMKKYCKAAMGGKSVKLEWHIMAGTPYSCWMNTTFIPVRNKEGAVIGVALNSTDVTHHKKQEAYINLQNDALNRIAIIQSHELRRPVASLLGIMDLIKMENVYFNYFEIMELTVNELDEKIRGIVKDSENTLHSRHLAVVA